MKCLIRIHEDAAQFTWNLDTVSTGRIQFFLGEGRGGWGVSFGDSMEFLIMYNNILG